jgi:hypothetical protein
MENKIYLTIAECMDTNGEFSSEVYLNRTAQESGETAWSLIAMMCETMGLENIDPTTQWEIGNEDWWYRVRTEEHNF